MAERAVDRIPGADLIAEESPVAHYGVFSIINHRKNDPKFVAFMNDVDRLDKAQQNVDKKYRVPGVAANIDPKKSFWKEYVTYPYPVKYTDVKDGTGTTWQIGYMDEYAGDKPDPQVPVIIHGKGAFAGHYGNVMQYALRSGFRAIAPDLPHYGMSGPGNLDKSPAPTIQHMRKVVHELVVNQLGVQRAAYMGHSLGGQLILGYALTWPDTVQDLILEAPAGLEEYPRDVVVGPGKTAPLFDPSFARDFEKWKQVWEPTGALAAEMGRTEQGVRGFFYFHPEQRVGLIKGNPKELEQWVNVFIYDIYGMVIELQKDDPQNLYERLTRIKAPIFLAFGDKEPFIPGTYLNGLKDLGRDVINPFMSRMIEVGDRPVLKIYPDTGHFIHTDNPVEFRGRHRRFHHARQCRTVSSGSRQADQWRSDGRDGGGADASRAIANCGSEQIRRGVSCHGCEQAGEVHRNVVSARRSGHRHRLAGLRRQRPSGADQGLLLDAAARVGHACRTRRTCDRLLPSRHAFHRRHHRRTHAAAA
jgi:homoserine O-acetyltransferase/O-succinyltransferase